MASLRADVRSGPQMPQGLPLFKPPYSRITAIDLNTGDHAWMVPTGAGNRYRRRPRLRDLDLPPLGGDNGNNGPLLTKTRLVYCLTAGGTNDGPRWTARNTSPSRWEVGLGWWPSRYRAEDLES